MFEARLINGGILKKILEAIKDLLKETNFDCSETGVQLQAMDGSHVALVSLRLRRDGFENYRCDRSLSLGMNVDSLVKILKCCGNDDVVTMRAYDNSDVTTFTFESKKNGRVSEFDMKLMRLDQEYLGIPEVEYACVIDMPSGEFGRIIRDLSQFGESIAICCSKVGIKFSATGDIGTGNIKVAETTSADGKNSKKDVRITLSEPITLTFASKYLSSFAKATSLSERVKLSMSTEVPLTVEFKIFDEENDYGYIRFYLAPKIEDDDLN